MLPTVVLMMERAALMAELVAATLLQISCPERATAEAVRLTADSTMLCSHTLRVSDIADTSGCFVNECTLCTAGSAASG